jgi:hypothetical protein
MYKNRIGGIRCWTSAYRLWNRTAAKTRSLTSTWERTARLAASDGRDPLFRTNGTVVRQIWEAVRLGCESLALTNTRLVLRRNFRSLIGLPPEKFAFF